MILNQINLQHCKAASAELSRRFAQNQFDVALIQEPYIFKDKVKGLDSGGDIVYLPGNSRPRTCIYVRNSIKYIALPQFCTGDETTIKLFFQKDSDIKLEIIICSAYFPFDSAEAPPSKNVKELVNYCNVNNKLLLISCDSNAHHVVWGSNDTNARGGDVLDFILINNLHILNKGCEPTFINAIRKEVLDITITSSGLLSYITDWRVLDEVTLSDHRCIRFKIKSLPHVTIKYRNPRKTNWNLYRDVLFNNLVDLKFCKITNVMNLNQYADKLQSAIMAAYHESCKEKERKTNREVPWYNDYINNLRKSLRKLWNKSKKKIKLGMFNDPAVFEYKEALNKYRNELMKSKRNSWQQKCAEINSIEEGSRLFKFLSKDGNRNIGSFKKQDGSYTETIDECLTLLLKTHFPNCIIQPGQAENVLEETESLLSASGTFLAESVVTLEKLSWAIDSFRPYKSPGRDMILPALLQQGKDIILPHLCRLFKFSIATGLIPNSWSGVNVTFIPKPGKTSYADPKSFRPISLMSFVLKTLEKLIDRHIKDTTLTLKPLHKFQYAYQQGKSTEAALHHAVSKMEQTITNKEIGIAAFLDIEGAFDNTSFEIIKRSAYRFGIDQILINWIHNMLSKRNVKATLFNHEILVKPTQGTPQGGCLSTLLWSLVVDDLICTLNDSGGIFALGYADDILVYVTGKYGSTVSEVAQRALKISEKWCKNCNLSINPSKATILPITHRYKTTGLKLLKLFETYLPYSSQVKYLGVILDKRLNWEAQLDHITDKAVKSFYACRSLVGRTWGVKPNIMRWIYTQVIIPRITYGSIVWWHRTSIEKFKLKLTKIQRLAALTITGAMKSAPTSALETILGLPPLHLVMEAKAKSCAIRLASTEMWGSWNQTTNHCILTQFLLKHKEYWSNPDKIIAKFNFQKPFKILIPNRDNPYDLDNVTSDTTIWFTDGSKSEEGVGFGVCCLDRGVDVGVGLEEHSTIYQAELLAINKCAEICLNEGFRNKDIIICSDSQAALKSLTSNIVKSKTVLNCLENIKHLGRNNNLKLIWVPGHSGILGNEKADEIAKNSVSLHPLHRTPFMESLWKGDVKRWLSQKHKSFWKNSDGMKTSKTLFPTIDDKKINDLTNLKRNDLRLLTGVLTGHCPLRKHLNNIGILSNPNCRFCDITDETPIHILNECDKLATKRIKYFGEAFPPIQQLHKLKLNTILNYFKDLGIPEFSNNS
jgi:ribonuclease HI